MCAILDPGRLAHLRREHQRHPRTTQCGTVTMRLAFRGQPLLLRASADEASLDAATPVAICVAGGAPQLVAAGAWVRGQDGGWAPR